MTPKSMAYLIEKPESNWRDFVDPTWAPPAESLIAGVLMDKAFHIDHRQLGAALDRWPGSVAARLRLRAKHEPIIRASENWPDLRPKSLDHAFQYFTGGVSLGEAKTRLSRTREAVQGTAEFAAALSNTLNRILLQAYVEADYQEQTLARFVTVSTYRPQRVPGVSSVKDLGVVLENADYLETDALTTWVSSAAPVKHGNLEVISYEATRNDDVQAIARRVQELAVAARRTRARAVWSLLVNNSPYQPDALPWFDLAHGDNAMTAPLALAATEVSTAIQRAQAQVRPGTTEVLNVPLVPGNYKMVVPAAGWEEAYAINQTISTSLFHAFGDRNEHIVASPFLPAGQWAIYVRSDLIESVRCFHVDQEEPVIELAANAAQGALFSKDQITYRVHHHYAPLLVEYRGAVRSVAP
jgi:hypothetical protein